MRVLHVLHSLNQNYGGPIRAVLDLSAKAGAIGLDSEVVGLGPISIPDNPFPSAKIHSIPTRFPKSYGYAPQLPKWLAENLHRFDGVILHGMWLYPNWAAANACRRQQTPYVCFPHGMFEPWALFGQGSLKAAKKVVYWNIVERDIFRNAAALFFTTNRERTLAAKLYSPANGVSFIVVPYGVDRHVESVAAPNREKISIAGDRKVALFLGRVHPKKNLELLIEAWGLAKPSAEWSLLIAGPVEPNYKSKLERLARKHRVSHQIQFAGPVAGTDKNYLLGRASWFLLPSKQENFGISVLEAISAKCPVAISDQVFLSDYFHERSEILPVQLDAWTNFIRHRMPDEHHRQALIDLDQQLVIPQFAIDGIVKSWAGAITSAFTRN